MAKDRHSKEYWVWYRQSGGGKEKFREYWRRLRKATLELMGNKCVRCGFSDARALQIDHIHGHGGEDKRRAGKAYPLKVMDSLMKNEGKYQLLCANCNWIKRCENNETVLGRIFTK